MTERTMPRLAIGTAVEFELPRPVASSKNRRRVFARGRRVISLPSEQAEIDATMIANIAKLASNGIRFDRDDALRLEMRHDLARDVVLVKVEKIGELSARGARGTRRDVHGMIETIADALQEVLYDDDRAVDAVECRRVRP